MATTFEEALATLEASDTSRYDHRIARLLVELCPSEKVAELVQTLSSCEADSYLRYVTPWLPGGDVPAALLEVLEESIENEDNGMRQIAVMLLMNEDIHGLEERLVALVQPMIKATIAEHQRNQKLDWREWSQDSLDALEAIAPLFKRRISPEIGKLFLSLRKDELLKNEHLVEILLLNDGALTSNQRDDAFVDSIGAHRSLTAWACMEPQTAIDIASRTLKSRQKGRSDWNSLDAQWMLITLIDHGTEDHLPLLDMLSEKELEKHGRLVHSAKTILEARASGQHRSGVVPLEGFEYWTQVAVKDSWGFSESRLRGYYTGQSQGVQPAAQRHAILSGMLERPLGKIHRTRFEQSCPTVNSKWKEASRDFLYLVGEANHGQFTKRIQGAVREIQKSPWKSWPYHVHEVLAEDRWELTRTHGVALGYLPLIEKSSLGMGIVSCRVLNFHVKHPDNACCENSCLTVKDQHVTCHACDATFGNLEDDWNSAVSKFRWGWLEEEDVVEVGPKFSVTDKGSVTMVKQNGDVKKFSKKESEELITQARKLVVEAPLFIRDHLAAMYADIDEYAGIGGDHSKRWGLR